MTEDVDFDVLIVGAGISGVDAGRHLKRTMPHLTFAMLEAERGIGGTWRLHRYPGARSDSDLYTFGFGWKPWTGRELATAPEILAYLEEAVAEEGLAPHIRFGKKLTAADWSEAGARWTLTLADAETGENESATCRFLWMCQGYYDHARGHAPDLPGRAEFPGPVIHPQHWPEGETLAGRRVAVIGSGATAATLVPALAETAAHVVIVQRTPTYYYSKPSENELAALLRPLDLPDATFHDVMRRKSIHDGAEITRRAFEEPEALRDELLAGVEAYLAGAAGMAPHFTPDYRPWNQRLAVVPDGDLFAAIRAGRASVVTGRIATLTDTGLTMEDGTRVDADAIVSATGIELSVMGGVPFTVDGRAFDFAAAFTRQGILFTGAPNMAWTFGYIRASWTLRADLVSAFVCRLLAHMEARGAHVAEPRLRSEEAEMAPRLLIEPENFNPGYIRRSIHLLPKQGDRQPWIFSQDYLEERETIPASDLDDGTIAYR